MLQQQFEPKGRFVVEFFHKDGTMFHKEDIKNGITNQGKNYVLNAAFRGGTIYDHTDWVIGLINASGYTGVAATDASPVSSGTPGWDEATSYTEYATSRPLWSPATSVSQSLTNSTPASFAITASLTLKGVFLYTQDTGDGDSSDVIWSTALFSSDVNVINGDTLKITYTLSC